LAPFVVFEHGSYRAPNFSTNVNISQVDIVVGLVAVAFCQSVIATIQGFLQKWLFSYGSGVGYVMSAAILFPIALVSMLSTRTVLWRGAPFFNDSAVHDIVSIVAIIIMIASYGTTLLAEVEIKSRNEGNPISSIQDEGAFSAVFTGLYVISLIIVAVAAYY
jgi:hypothetical protein